MDTDDIEGCEFSKKFRAETSKDMAKPMASELQNVERGSVLKSMHDARKKLDARWSMPDARSLKVDRRCPMHGELWMLDGRCTMHVL